jgi:hypothetical protein
VWDENRRTPAPARGERPSAQSRHTIAAFL